MIGLLSGTVTAAARSTGHIVALGITALLMVIVSATIFRTAKWGHRSRLPALRRWTPFVIIIFAAFFILADLVRHVVQDNGGWAECGANTLYSRINSTNPFPKACTWSSAQYACVTVCCVPVWRATNRSNTAYAWSPPQSAFFPATSEGQFATLMPSGSIAFDDRFDRAQYPYRVFKAPVWLNDDGEPLPRGSATAEECGGAEHVNQETGYCLLPESSRSKWPQKDGEASCDCDECTPFENMAHLSPVGWLFTFFFTYLGFALLTLAVLWNADIRSKLKGVATKWRELRRAGSA